MARDPARQFLAAYPVIHHALRQRLVGDPAGSRISAHQATVLSHLDKTAALTLSELAGEMGVALPTMSLLVDRLVKAGLIRRERDLADGRRVALRLTAAGDRAAHAASLLDADRVKALLAALSPADRAASVAGLVVLAQAARRLHSDQAGALQTHSPLPRRGAS